MSVRQRIAAGLAVGYVVELDVHDPATDTTTTERYASLNHGDPVGGFPRLLGSPGSSAREALGEPVLEGAGGGGGFDFQLHDEPGAPGLLHLVDGSKSIDGRAVRLLAGEPGTDSSTWEVIDGGVAHGEPRLTDDPAEGRAVVAIKAQHHVDRLRQPVRRRRYHGEPFAMRTAANSARAESNAPLPAQEPRGGEWTVSARVRMLAISADPNENNNGIVLFRIRGPANNWVYLNVVGDGRVRSLWRSATGSTVARYTAQALPVGRMVTVSSGYKADRVWIAVDGELWLDLADPPSYTPEAAAATEIDVGWCYGLAETTGDVQDVRLYTHYLAPEDAVAELSGPPPDPSATAGYWRFSDGAGSTVTDHSGLGVHLTFSVAGPPLWVTSGEGTPELAGRPMPAGVGAYHRGRADLVDPVREAYRYLDRDPAPIGADRPAPIVHSEGVPLDEGAGDYVDEGDGQILTLSAETPVLTVGLGTVDPSYSNWWSYPGATLGDFLEYYGGMTLATDVDEGRLDRLSRLVPHRSGFRLGDEDADGLATLVGAVAGLGGYVSADPEGRVAIDILLPPPSPGPRGGDTSTLELLGRPETEIRWPATAAPVPAGSSWSVGAWVLPHTVSTDLTETSIEGTFAQGVIVDKTDEGQGSSFLSGYGFGFAGIYSAGLSAWAGGLGAMAVHTVTSPVLRRARPWEWRYVGVTVDEVADETAFFFGQIGGAVVEVARVSGALTVADPEGYPLRIGSRHFAGGVAEVSVHSRALSLADHQALYDAPPATGAAGLEFFSGLSADPPVDIVSGGSAELVAGAVLRPDFVVDLRAQSRRDWFERRLTSRRAVVKYARNQAPLDPGAVAAAATREQRQAATVADLRRAGAAVPGGRDWSLDSPLYDAEGAAALLRLHEARASGLTLATLSRRRDDGVDGRDLAFASPGDVVRVVGRGGISRDWRTLRARADRKSLDAELDLLGWES